MKMRWIPAFMLAGIVLLSVSVYGLSKASAASPTLIATPAIAPFGAPVTFTGTTFAPSSVTLSLSTGTWTSATTSSGDFVTGVGTNRVTYTATTAGQITAVTHCDFSGGVIGTIQVLTGGVLTTAQSNAACNSSGGPQLACVPYTLNFSPDNSTNAPCQSACPAVNANMLGPSMGPCSFPYPAASGGLASCPYPYSNPITNNYLYGQNPPNPFPSYVYPTTSGLCSTPVAVAGATAASSTPSQISVSTDSPNLACGSTTLVTVNVKDAAGNNVPDGTNVTLKSTSGTLATTQSTTSSGYVWGVLTVSSIGGGPGTITATAGSVSGTATFNVNCGQSSPPSGVAVPTVSNSGSATTGVTSPGQPRPAQTSGVIFTPPNTGDAGLQGTSLLDD